MDSARAREILRLYRPGTTDALDPQMAEALQAVPQDPELAKWFEGHCAIYIAIRTKLKQIEAPQDLKRKILVENVGRARIIPLYRNPRLLWGVAAVLALLAGGLHFFNKTPSIRFEAFRDWKVSEVVRGYNMTPNTNYAQITSYLTTNHFISDYSLGKALAKLPVAGFATRPFQGKPVTMLCFTGAQSKSGKTNDLFFFVAHGADFAGSPDPGKKPQYDHKDSSRGHFTTATWTTGDKVYILVIQGEDSDLQQYLD